MNDPKQKLTDFIRQVFPMTMESAAEIVAFFNEKDFKKNELILKQGKVCNEYYFLEQGFARAFAHDPDGNDVTTAFYSSNQVVCELFSFFKRIPSGENIQTLDDCKTWFITFDQLQVVFHSLQQFREFGRAILVNAYATLKQRTLYMITKTAEERYVQLMETSPDVFQHAALKNIATYLGITDTSLSRIRREFSKK
ncbi:MAG: Crp/Fnr family transcriptional regulator [Chitinophagaceae bacterium]